MWVEAKPSWIRTVLLGGFALPHIWLRTAGVTFLATVVTYLYEAIPQLHYSITTTPFTLIGLPLGIFLGFRNNAAYDRFWEGRKLWGTLVNQTRNFARQLVTFIEAPDADQEELSTFQKDMVRYVIAYVHALRYHLRDMAPLPRIARVLPEAEAKRYEGVDNVPIAMLQRIGNRLLEARRKGWVHVYHAPLLEHSLSVLTDVQGACERIKTTPIPYSYTVLLHRIVAVYCIALPFGLMDAIKWATPVVVLIVSYCFFGLDGVGDELEQPFGMDINDLPLKAISRTIERNLREGIGDEIPPKTAANKGVMV
ncbi:MAG: bestrophin family protein [Labilithrix sp.]|nr:bestrophin family protein [Labilithrix sp.]MCW5809898.1 bestrophin family protein [Labilithrix sp.]